MVGRHWFSLNRQEKPDLFCSTCVHCSWAMRVSHGITSACVMLIVASVTFSIELLCPPRFSISGQLSLCSGLPSYGEKGCVLHIPCAECFLCCAFQLPAPSQSSSEGKHCPQAVSATKCPTQEAPAMLAALASCWAPLLSSTVCESEHIPPQGRIFPGCGGPGGRNPADCRWRDWNEPQKYPSFIRKERLYNLQLEMNVIICHANGFCQLKVAFISRDCCIWHYLVTFV